MIDFGYSKFQVGTANIYFGLGGFMNWSYGADGSGGGVVSKQRTMMGAGA